MEIQASVTSIQKRYWEYIIRIRFKIICEQIIFNFIRNIIQICEVPYIIFQGLREI